VPAARGSVLRPRTTRRRTVGAVGHDPVVDELVTPGGLRLDGAALTWRVTRSGGPGGQHANTSDTSVVLTVHLPDAGLPAADTERLVAALGPTVTARSSDSRSQWRNRQLAWERLAARLDGAARPPRPRHATRPTKSARAERLDGKRRRSTVKRTRRRPSRDDWGG
jgi:ribosome-associated protein